MAKAHKATEPKVIFEDKALLVLNKPAGLVVHPAPSYHGTTLVDWIREYLGTDSVQDFEEDDRLGLVHRLDKDTSGVIVFTKTPEAKTVLGRQFHDRLIQKQYAAFIQGAPPKRTGIISAPIGRSKQVPTRMAITGDGRPSETSFEVEETMKEVSLLNLYPKTGRTHQLRVHCAAIGHPIVGDTTYGASAKLAARYGIERPLLHAFKLELSHPISGKRMSFQAPWPADMKKARTSFRRAVAALAMLVLLAPLGYATKPRQAGASSGSSSSSSGASKSASSSSSTATSASSSLKREMAAVREQFKALIEEVSALQDRVNGIQSSLDDLGAARRLRDLEKAISDLNGKSVSTSSAASEAETQAQEAARKIKYQQDQLDQLRDQVDRLQRDLIQAKTRTESAPEPAQRAQ